MAADDSATHLSKARSSGYGYFEHRANRTIKFIRMTFLVMLSSPKLTYYLERIQSLPEPALGIIASLMQEVSGWDPDKLPDEVDHPDTLLTVSIDDTPETPLPNADLRAEVFQLEEQYAKIMSQLERRNRDYELLESEHHAISETLGRSQETNVSSLDRPYVIPANSIRTL